MFESEDALLNAELKLKENNILPRRYFYPSLSELSYVDSGEVKVARDISATVLCLPVYYDLNESELAQVVNFIKQVVC